MPSANDEVWAESRIDRQNSVAGDGWSRSSDFEDSNLKPAASRSRRPAAGAGTGRLLMMLTLAIAAAAAAIVAIARYLPHG